MHSAFNLFVFPNSMFTPLLFFFYIFFYERAMSSPEKLHLKITIIIIIIIIICRYTQHDLFFYVCLLKYFSILEGKLKKYLFQFTYSPLQRSFSFVCIVACTYCFMYACIPDKKFFRKITLPTISTKMNQTCNHLPLRSYLSNERNIDDLRIHNGVYTPW